MTQKEIAIKCLEILDIYKPYINKFKSKAGTPCFFENYIGFYVDQEPEIYNKVKEIEKDHGCLVYALSHDIVNGDEMWSMLCVPKDVESAEDVLGAFNTQEYYAFSYAWNRSVEYFSEFGDIVIRSFGGGVKRVH